MACRWSSQHKLKWLSVRILSNGNLLAFWSWILTGTCLNHASHCQFYSSQCLFFVYLPINVWDTLNPKQSHHFTLISPYDRFYHINKKKHPPKPSIECDDVPNGTSSNHTGLISIHPIYGWYILYKPSHHFPIFHIIDYWYNHLILLEGTPSLSLIVDCIPYHPHEHLTALPSFYHPIFSQILRDISTQLPFSKSHFPTQRRRWMQFLKSCALLRRWSWSWKIPDEPIMSFWSK